jgi:hypothetical protein
MNKVLAATAAFGPGAALASCVVAARIRTSRPEAAGDGGTAAGGGTSSCGLGEGTSGIEGTGLRRKLTGRITDVKSGGAGSNTVVTVGTACFTASGASVFQGSAPASLADLRVDQIIAAEGEFDSTSASYANTIYSPRCRARRSLQEPGRSAAGPTISTATGGPRWCWSPRRRFIDGDRRRRRLAVAADGSRWLRATTFDSDHNPSGLLSGHARNQPSPRRADRRSSTWPTHE